MHTFKRSLTATLIGILLSPASLTLVPSDSSARAVAVRGPRGGGAAAVRGPVRAPAYRGPAGVHGTARRTSRRVARRTTRRLSVLPRGYTTVAVAGVSYYYASGVYYEPVYQGNTVVYVEVVFD